MASSSSNSCTLRERIFVRYEVGNLKRLHPDANITTDVILRGIVASHNGNEDYATTEKYYTALTTARNCFHRAESPYFFNPYRFNVRVMPHAVSGQVLTNLRSYLEYVEENQSPRNISETLKESNNPLWYLDKSNSAVSDVSQIISNLYRDTVDNSDIASTFDDFVAKDKMPFLASNLSYEVGKECVLVLHQDADGVFFSCVLINNDSHQGRLHVSNYSLPEEFHAEDFVMMDPRVFHEVTTYARKEQRKVVVFTYQCSVSIRSKEALEPIQFLAFKHLVVRLTHTSVRGAPRNYHTGFSEALSHQLALLEPAWNYHNKLSSISV